VVTAGNFEVIIADKFNITTTTTTTTTTGKNAKN
jgi:hypothetical protein